MNKSPVKTKGKGKKMQHPLQVPTEKPFNDRMWIILLFFMAFALFANSIPNGYVLDDSGVLKDNFIVKKGFDGIPLILKTPYRYGSGAVIDDLYRPLSLVMFAAEWQISPKNPSVNHFVNVFFYAINCALLFLVLRKLFSRHSPLLPLFATLLWMAHPIHTEVVANIKSRDEIMSVFFLFLALLGFIRYLNEKGTPWLVLSVILYTLSFFSKEGVITCLVIFPLVGWYITGKIPGKTVIGSVAMVVPALVYMMVRHYVLGRFPAPPLAPVSITDNLLFAAPDLAGRLATAIMILGKYLFLLIVPYQLVSDYSYNQIPLVGFGDPAAILSLLVYAGALGYAVFKIRSRSVAVFGILFFMVTMSIYSNIFKLIGSSFGERFLFLPSIGFCLVLAWAILLLVGKEKSSGPKVPSSGKFRPELGLSVGLLVITIVFYSVKTIARNAEWKSQWTLFGADVKRSPQSAHMHYYWGLTIRDKGKDLTDQAEYRNLMLQAIGEFKTALGIYSYYPECYEQLGLAYFRIHDYDESLKNYEQALKLNPYTSVTYGNMGIIYFQKGDLQKALELYQKSVTLDPNYDDGYFNLGSTYGTLGQFDKAIENFKKCLEIRPDYAQAYYFLGLTYNNLKQFDEGKKYLDKAYQLDPTLKK